MTQFDTRYPSVTDLKIKAKKRIPNFAFDYLEGGCSDERSLRKTMADFDKIFLKENFVREILKNPNIRASFCGIEYDAPFGISPIGLQGLMWPNAPLILAKAAKDYKIPYVLSTVSTNSIEEVAKISEGQALFQLYNPACTDIRDDIIRRLKENQYRALIVTADVASFGYRPRDIRNGLSILPKITLNHIIQAITHPTWSLNMLFTGGAPKLRTLLPYMKQDNMQDMASFMNEKMMGGVSMEQLKAIRNLWHGPLIVKGILTEHDMEKCIDIGADGVVVSNHGARQMDAGQTAISVLPLLVQKYSKRIHISFDSGIQSGTDIACALASGAKFVFSGRSFVYGVSALGQSGAGHTIEMFEHQLSQVMRQIGCEKISDLSNFLVK